LHNGGDAKEAEGDQERPVRECVDAGAAAMGGGAGRLAGNAETRGDF